MIVDQLSQHRDEAVHGVGRLAVGTGQPANRVIGAIHLRAAVDQVQTRRRGHRAGKLQYIIRVMRFRLRAALLAALVAAATSGCSGRNGLLGPQYRIRRRSHAQPRRFRDAGRQRVDPGAGRASRVRARSRIPARAPICSRPTYARRYHVPLRRRRTRRAVDAIGPPLRRRPSARPEDRVACRRPRRSHGRPTSCTRHGGQHVFTADDRRARHRGRHAFRVRR